MPAPSFYTTAAEVEKALSEANFPLLKQMREQGIDFLSIEKVMHHAVSSGSAACVQFVIDCGYAGSGAAEWGGYHATPLFLAAESGHLECARLLLPLENVWVANPLGNCAQNFAATHGQLECLRLLTPALTPECPPEPLALRRIEGQEPRETGFYFHARSVAAAAAAGQVECLRLFAPFFADFEIDTRASRSPLEMAAEKGQTEAISFLLRHFPAHEVDAEGNTPLIFAAKAGHELAARALLPGSRANHANRDGNRALEMALGNGSVPCVEALASSSALDARQGPGQNTALQLAASYGMPAAIRALMAQGADARAAGGQGQTPLMASMIDDMPDCVRILAPHSDLGAMDAEGRTALAHGVRHKSWAAVDALLRALNDAEFDAAMRAHADVFSTLPKGAFPQREARLEARELAAAVLSAHSARALPPEQEAAPFARATGPKPNRRI